MLRIRKHTVACGCLLGLASLLLLDSSLALVGHSRLWGYILPLSLPGLGIFYIAVGLWYAVTFTKTVVQARWRMACGLTVLLVLQVGACVAIYAAASRHALSEAESVTLAFLQAPDRERVHFAEGVPSDILATLRGQQFSLTLSFASQPYQRFGYLIRPSRGKAIVVRLQRNVENDEFFVDYPNDYQIKNTSGESVSVNGDRKVWH